MLHNLIRMYNIYIYTYIHIYVYIHIHIYIYTTTQDGFSADHCWVCGSAGGSCSAAAGLRRLHDVAAGNVSDRLQGGVDGGVDGHFGG